MGAGRCLTPGPDHRSSIERKMWRLFFILAVTCAGVAAPGIATAQSPVTDSFDTFNGWNTYGDGAEGWVLVGGSGGQCHKDGCIRTGTAYTTGIYRGYKTGSPVAQGALTIWSRYHIAWRDFGPYMVLCKGAPISGGINCEVWGIPAPNDDTWHQYYMAWRDNAASGTKEFCKLRDDTNPAHCIWVAAQIFKLGDAPDTIGLAHSTGARFDLGDALWWDELAPASLIAPFMISPLKCGDPQCRQKYSQGAYTAGIVTTVLDHSLKKNPPPSTFWQYGTVNPKDPKDEGGDGVIVAFTGEKANGTPKKSDDICISGPVDRNGFVITLNGMANLFGCGPGYASYDEHPGYDYVAAHGTPVMAVADGAIVNNGGEYCYKTYRFQKPQPCVAWGYVGIDHDNGYISQYGHLSQIFVSPGQKVKQGDVIGLSGHTAPEPIHLGAHLHFEVLKVANGTMWFVDPYGWSGQTIDPLYCPNSTNCLAGRPQSIKLWE